MQELEKLTRDEIGERVKGSKVLVEITLLNQHLNSIVNGVDIHARSKFIRCNLIAYKSIIETEHEDNMTFEELKEEYPEKYRELISYIATSVWNFHYKV